MCYVYIVYIYIESIFFFCHDTDTPIHTYSSTLTFSTQVRSLQVVCQTLKRLRLNRLLVTWHAGTSSPVGWRWNAWNTSLAEPSWGSLQNAFPSPRGSVQFRSVLIILNFRSVIHSLITKSDIHRNEHNNNCDLNSNRSITNKIFGYWLIDSM